MTQVVTFNSGFNVENVFVPDVYLTVEPPTSYFGGVPTSVAFIDGTAGWGELDTPVAISDPQGVVSTFGGITAAAITDTHDLCVGLSQALNQAAGTGGLVVYGVRRSNGSDTAASATLVDTTSSPVTGITVTASQTGTKGAEISILLQAGVATATVDAIVIPFPGGGAVELFPGLPSAGATFWAALQNALNNGLSPTRGPSKWLKASGATTTTNTPALGQVFLTGGNDGRTAITTAELIGSNAGAKPTGIYTAQGLLFTPSVMWVSGLTDTAALPALQTFCTQTNLFALFAFASGTDTATAISTKQTAGIYDYHIGFLKDWQYYFDQINNDVRLIDPNHTAGGKIATLGPWQSPLDQPVQNIIGTERTNPYTGNQPYSYAELAQLGAAGIMVITNPTPAGNVFAFRNGYNSVGNNAATAYVEYSRMTNFLANTIGTLLGPILGLNQGFSAGDPTRALARSVVNTFLQTLQSANFIAGFNVTCDLTNNSQVSIAQHLLKINVLVTYMSSVQVVFTQLQGGTTVVVTQNATGNQLISQLGLAA